MSNLQYRQEKIQAKRKTTPWRDFIMNIASWQALNLYRNSGFISKYPSTERSPKILKTRDFEEKRDNLIKEGLDYDLNRTFNENIQELWHHIDMPSLLTYGGNENAEFSDGAHNGKNIYLVFLTTFGCENIGYSMSIKDACRNIYNSTMITQMSENVYQCFGIIQSFNIFYSKYIENSSDIWFSVNLIGCNECILCNGLVNQSYCIQNKQYSKEEYNIYKQKILTEKQKFGYYYEQVSLLRGNNIETYNSSGTFLTNCNEVTDGYACFNLQRGKNSILVQSQETNEDMIDVFMCGRSTHFYGAWNAGGFSEHIYCSGEQGRNSNMYYTINTDHCSFCLGCIGLKNKSYCILNKQYSKEERYQKVDKIFAQMENDGQLGEFFPASMNPFYFNDTAAYLIDPSFTKEEVTKLGYLWRDEPIKVDIPEGAEVVKVSELGDYEGFDAKGNRIINPSILSKVIQDEQGNVRKIIKMEYDFLMKYGLPLPRKHRLERMKENFRIS